MVSQLIFNIINSYEQIRGTGKILVLFVVALAFWFLAKKEEGFNPISFMLSPIACIGAAFAKAIEAAKKKNKLTVILAVCICAFVIMQSGMRVAGKEFFDFSRNTMHIPGEYVEVMDYLLNDSPSPYVATTPEYSIYNTAYSDRFDMLYEEYPDADMAGADEAVRIVYEELGAESPDFERVAIYAKKAGCEYVLVDSSRAGKAMELENYGYAFQRRFPSWYVFKRGEAKR